VDVGEVAVVLVWRVGLPECYVMSCRTVVETVSRQEVEERGLKRVRGIHDQYSDMIMIGTDP
jgi:hypothetical protein